MNDAQLQGRPKKGPEPAFSLSALVPLLEKYLQTKVMIDIFVRFAWCFDTSVKALVHLQSKHIFGALCVKMS